MEVESGFKSKSLNEESESIHEVSGSTPTAENRIKMTDKEVESGFKSKSLNEESESIHEVSGSTPTAENRIKMTDMEVESGFKSKSLNEESESLNDVSCSTSAAAENRIKKCLEIIKENIQFLNANDGCKFFADKEKRKWFLNRYSKFIRQALKDIDQKLDNYHKNNDLYEKYDKLYGLLENSTELEGPVCRFFDDTNLSMKALTIDYKRKYLEGLLDSEKSYDVVIDILEKKCLDQKSTVENYVKKELESI